MQRHVFSASDEGGALLRLSPDFANANGNAIRIAVSPDRQHVAYAADADVDETYEVYVVPTGGGTATRVSSGFPAATVIGQIAWAPDSSQIAYIANPQGNAPRGFRHWEVFLADRDGSNDRKINGSVGSPPVVSVAGIKWSPDSRYLAQTVLSLDPFQTVIGLNTYDATLGTPNSTRITPTAGGRTVAVSPIWPISRSTVVSTCSSATPMARTICAFGSVALAEWSPDGIRVAYTARQDDSTGPQIARVSFSRTGSTTFFSRKLWTCGLVPRTELRLSC